MGCTLHHDDSLNDRTEGGTLDVSFRGTKMLWFEMYGEEYTIAGGMYRGEPPASYYNQEWPMNQGLEGGMVKFPEDVIIGKQMYQHLVGVVGGSSTGVPETSKNDTGNNSIFTALQSSVETSAPIVVAEPVINTGWMSLDTEGAFIPGVENIPHQMRIGYVYGKHDSKLIIYLKIRLTPFLSLLILICFNRQRNRVLQLQNQRGFGAPYQKK
jgi:hypothetical protein